MVNFTILAGGYTPYITSYLFNTDDNTLTYLDQHATGPNVSWISSHPTNKSILYATNEKTTDGDLQSFTVGPKGALTLVDTVSSGGDSPAYCAGLSTGQVGVPNYGSGSAHFISTEDDHLHFSSNSDTLVFPVPTTGTQGASEPHMIYEYGGEIFIPDKGDDKVWRLGRVDDSTGYAVHGFIQQPVGSGPRHIHIRDNMLYTLHELANTLALQEVPSSPNATSQILSSVSIIPPGPPTGSAFAAAEILIPEPTAEYPIPYIYASNRNIGDVQDPRGDTIAIFENVDNQLVIRNQVYTGLSQIRGMMSGEQAGLGGEAYIVAAGVAGTAGVKVFKRTDGGANLEEAAVNTVIPTRSTFVWLDQCQVSG